jgi:hypothetical protein
MPASSTNDIELTKYMESLGFFVRNGAAEAASSGSPATSNVHALYGFQSNGDMLAITGFAIPGVYTVALYSPPPTQHNDDLERRLLEVGSEFSTCKVQQVGRYENADSAKQLYETFFDEHKPATMH